MDIIARSADRLCYQPTIKILLEDAFQHQIAVLFEGTRPYTGIFQALPAVYLCQALYSGTYPKSLFRVLVLGKQRLDIRCDLYVQGEAPV